MIKFSDWLFWIIAFEKVGGYHRDGGGFVHALELGRDLNACV